ncbi:hypothetical protein CRG98_002681 [Punica granatum]|uniref:Retrotransposon Copia-like N-terminal domain-containing protein n=1 Tax=Punica granatum TaxID=22663 RepID=A0A2I0L865_PUNGR|nr:hypothetical protein CRG98_002681 [Punica granatum]
MSSGTKEPTGTGTSVPSAFVLSPLDGPSNQLISCLLNGRNYLTWLRAMRTVIRAKNKPGFLDGTVMNPNDGDPLADQWHICNSMLVAWIFNHLEKHLQTTIDNAEDAKVLWDDLKERYSQAELSAGGARPNGAGMILGGDQYAITVAGWDT